MSGRVGGSPFSITGQCNAMGTREAGFTSSMPGYRKFENAKDREDLATHLGCAGGATSHRGGGLPIRTSSTAVLKKKIRALWIIATNPLVSFPNIDVLKQALGTNLEFLVVQDGFHPTPTTELAHLVLPAAIWGEKEGTYTNSERRVSKVNAAVPSPGEALSDFEIFLRVAQELDCGDKLFPGWRTPADAFEEWKRVSEGRLCDYSGITYEALEETGGMQWPFPKESTSPAGAARRLYTDGKFHTADGRARFYLLRLGTLSRAAECAVSFCPQYGKNGGALAHAHQDRRGSDPGALIPARVAGDESASTRSSSRCARTTWLMWSPLAGESAAWNCA